MLERLLLVSCICIIVALVLYFFYWNRLLGLLISLALRVLYWNQEGSSCWVEIGRSFIVLVFTVFLTSRNIRFYTFLYFSWANISQGLPLPFE